MLAAAEDAHTKDLLVHCRWQDFYSEHCREPSPRYCFCCLLWCLFHLPHPAAPFKLLDLAFRTIVAVQPMYSEEEGLAADAQANILKAATGLNRQQIRACAIETSAKVSHPAPLFGITLQSSLFGDQSSARRRRSSSDSAARILPPAFSYVLKVLTLGALLSPCSQGVTH